MKFFSWNHEKNQLLKRERGISFEDVLFYIERGQLLDIVEHPNQEKYTGQKVFIVNIGDYAYLIPFIETEDEVFGSTMVNVNLVDCGHGISDHRLTG